MRIIERAKKVYSFIVLKSFYWEGRVVKIGEEIEIPERSEQDGMVVRGCVKPADLPEVGVYIALGEIVLPGRVEKFTCKKLDLIELKSEDGLRLMLSGQVIPKNDSQWRFHNRRLGAPKGVDYKKKAILADAEKSKGIEEAAEYLKKLKGGRR